MTEGVSFRWFVDEELIQEGGNNQLEFQVGGTFIIRVEVTLANGCILVSEDQEFTIVVTNTETIEHLTSWEANPNPVEDILTVHLTTDIPQDLSLTLVNTTGKVIQKQSHVVQGQGQYNIDMKDLASGLYILMISDGEAIQTERIVKL